MPKSAVQPRNNGQRITLILVVASTVFAIIASGLKAADDNTYESLHMVALLVMLVCYMLFIWSVMSGKHKPVPKLELHRGAAEAGGESMADRAADGMAEYKVGCTSEQVICIAPWGSRTEHPAMAHTEVSGNPASASLPSLPTLELKTVPSWRKQAIRAIVVRHAVIDIPLLRLVSQFPNVSLLDIQGCQVEPDAWHELVHFNQLQYVLAYGAATPTELRELHFALPELQISLEPGTIRPSLAT
jgi:hypothetical protein